MAARERRQGQAPFLALALLTVFLAAGVAAAESAKGGSRLEDAVGRPRISRRRALLAGSTCTGCLAGFCEPASGCSTCDEDSGYQSDGTGGCTKGAPSAALTDPVNARPITVPGQRSAGFSRPFGFHPLCGPHAVLSRTGAGSVFGFGHTGNTVSVSLKSSGGSTVASGSGTVNGAGIWVVKLGRLPVGSGYSLTASSGGSSETASGVAVGELWLAAGQSNAFVSLGDTAASGGSPWRTLARQALASSANDPNLHLFKVPNVYSSTQQVSVDADWQMPQSSVVDSFSAVAYLTGKALRAHLKVPVGIVQSSYGGSSIVQWLPVSVASGMNLPHTDRDGSKRSCYNSMIAPLRNADWSGVTWYQGESDAGLTYVNPLYAYYQSLLTALLSSWRSTFGDPSLAFEIVQLPLYSSLYANSIYTRKHVTHWPYVREAQRQVCLKDAKADLVNILDLGSSNQVHPPNKFDVASRLVRAIRRFRYGQSVGGTGPTFSSVSYSTRRATVSFSNTASGLRLGTKTNSVGSVALRSSSSSATCFELRYGGTWYPASGKISGHTVKVTANSSKVKTPSGVRYAWTDNAHCNLYSTILLPAVPFTTDKNYATSVRYHSG